MNLIDFDYVLPKELIAQVPLEPRDSSRMMVLNRADGTLGHYHFSDLPKFLTSNDVLVFNQSKVIPARITFKFSGKECELFFLRVSGDNEWEVMVRPGKLFREGCKVMINDDVSVEVVCVMSEAEHGHRIVKVSDSLKRDTFDLLDDIGTIPLPPYIETAEGANLYQTVYASVPGSVAAPTAGFHFTQRLLDEIAAMHVQTEYVTLHVGAGTFLPVMVDKITDHVMHHEYYTIEPEVLSRLIEAKKTGKRIIGVGTTACRAIESCFKDLDHPLLEGSTNLFIYPGYEFKFIDSLITNFHLPKSTLLMLVSTLAGMDVIKKAYAEAVAEKYRFFSFGDGMFIV